MFAMARSMEALRGRAPGKQRVALEDEAAVGAGARDRRPVEHDVAVRLVDQPVEDAQERGLATAAGADDGGELALLDLEADVAERLDLAAGGLEEGLRYAARFQLRHGLLSAEW
jgi:hypothetical protein